MRQRVLKFGLVCLIITATFGIAVRFLAPAWFGYPTYASVETICPGDVNHDEQRDIRDVVAIQAHVLGKKTLAGDLLMVADVNQDSKVDVLDIVRLIQHITRRKLLVDCKGTLHVTPASLNFGDVRVATSKDLTLTVSNTGNARLTITAIGSDNAQFAAVSPAVPFDVASGSERSVVVRFSPASVASHSGTLTVSGNSAGSAMSAVVTAAGAGLTAANPTPTLTSLMPNSATAGSGAFTLTLTGTNFVEGSQVFWDGSPRSTAFVGPTQVTASIAAADIADDDVIVVRIVNPPPGGGLSAPQYFTVNPQPTVPPTGPQLRGLCPTKGPAGTQITLLGARFSATPNSNVVNFYRKGTTKAAAVLSASETTLVCQAPSGLEQGNWAVSVTVLDRQTTEVGFEVTADPPYLSIFPSFAFLLMPPGTGKEILAVGGGKPPYKLKPLTADSAAIAKVELKGTVIEVTGLATGQYGAADVTVQVEDSAGTPATTSATVRVQIPRFDPSFDVSFPSLLAGSSPSFWLKLSDNYGDMRLAQVRFKFENATLDTGQLKAASALASGDVDNGVDFHLLTVSSIDSPSRVNFEVRHSEEGSPVKIAGGTVEPGVITNRIDPPPHEEAVVPGGTDVWTKFRSGLIRLPASPGASFTITAVMTSITTYAGKNIPVTKVQSKSFTTVAPPSGSPTITALLGGEGATGELIWIEGTGLSTTPAGNKVTFAGPGGTRVEAEVKTVSGDHLSCLVPYGSLTGPVRLEVNGKVSNDYEFRVRFHPDVFISFAAFAAGVPARPQIVMRQEQGALRIGSLTITSDRGTFTAASLTKDQAAGTVHEYTPYGSTYSSQFFYRGQEPDGAKRHVFDYSGGSVKIYASTNGSGQGVAVEVSKTGGFDLSGSTFVFDFEKAIMTPPATRGVSVAFDVNINSVQWTVDPGNLMNVRFRNTRVTE